MRDRGCVDDGVIGIKRGETRNLDTLEERCEEVDGARGARLNPDPNLNADLNLDPNADNPKPDFSRSTTRYLSNAEKAIPRNGDVGSPEPLSLSADTIAQNRENKRTDRILSARHVSFHLCRTYHSGRDHPGHLCRS
jgi:hypothetical protein